MQSTKLDEYPFISIVIPAKNEEKNIGKCLNAVLQLDYSRDKYEIIVVDNYSSDNTKGIVRKYKDVILLDRKGSIGAIRNYGVKYARGEIIAFLDGDSVPDRKWFQIACNYLKEDESIGCIGFAISEPDDSASWVEKTWYKMGSSSKYKGGVCSAKWLSSFNLILKKKLFDQVGGFDEDLETCEDANLGYKLGEICRLIFSDEIKVKHLGNATTLREFFIKELWRGRSNLMNLIQSKNKIKDLPTVLVPMIFILLFLALITGLVLFAFGVAYNRFIFASLIMIIIIPLFLSLAIQRYYNLAEFIKITILYFFYLLARGFAIFRVRLRNISCRTR